LVLIAPIAILWADVGWAVRFDVLRDFQKLFFVPVVIAFFRYSDAGARVALSFLASCIALLALALATTFFPQLQWWQSWGPGVPVKNYITQSAEFAIAAFWLIYLALDAWKAGSRTFSIRCGCIAFLFFGHLIFVVTSRTELLILAILSLVTAAKWFGRKGLVSGLIALPIVALVAWSTSSYLRDRIQTTIADIQTYPLHGDETSTGFRMVFW